MKDHTRRSRTLRILGHLFSTTSLTRGSALAVLERVSALTHVTGSAEQLANHRERLTGGVNDWSVTRASMAYRSPILRAVSDLAARPVATNVLHASRLAAGALLVSPYGSNSTRSMASAVCLGVHTVVAPRHYYGADGSDHVAWMSQALSLVSRASRQDAKVGDAVLWLASMQAVMSYAVSGWVKLAGDKWRRGEALGGIMRTRIYGNRHAYQLLRRYPWLGRVAGAATLALECSYPLVYAGRGHLARPYMLASASMHLSIAGLMGLGRFVTAFLSLYGALAYTVQPRTAGGDARDDRLPRATTVAAVGMLTGLAGAGLVRRQHVLRPRPDEHALHSSTGAELRYRRHAGAVAKGPVFVLENGLMAPSGFWGWTVQELSALGDVITYHRAGYGASRPGEGSRGFQELVADLESLVSGVSKRPVVLVGHSIGGYLAHQLTHARPDLISAVVLVDSAHPAELRRSPQQRLGAETLVPSLRLTHASLLLGLGPLLEPPTWSYQIPEQDRAETLRIYRDARLWATAVQEWQAMLDQFETTDDVEHLSRPLLVLTARASVSSDPDMLELHQELAQSADVSDHVIIEGANHDTILTSRKVAEQVVRAIATFLAQSGALTSVPVGQEVAS